MLAAIETKFIPCTNHLPSRVKATCQAGSLTLSWDDALDVARNHQAAAKALARRLNWAGKWVGGHLPKLKRGYVFVLVKTYNRPGHEEGFWQNGFDVPYTDMGS